MVFILAKDIDEAEEFIHEEGIDKKHTRHVFSPLSLKGSPRGMMYIKVGEWFARNDIEDIMYMLNELQAVELEVIG